MKLFQDNFTFDRNCSHAFNHVLLTVPLVDIAME